MVTFIYHKLLYLLFILFFLNRSSKSFLFYVDHLCCLIIYMMNNSVCSADDHHEWHSLFSSWIIMRWIDEHGCYLYNPNVNQYSLIFASLLFTLHHVRLLLKYIMCYLFNRWLHIIVNVFHSSVLTNVLTSLSCKRISVHL